MEGNLKNKILFFLTVLFFVFYFSSCTKKETETIKTDSGEVSYTKNMKDSVKIPEGYPGEILPVYKNAVIVSAAKQNDGSFVIISFSGDATEKVISFYKNVLKDASVVMKTEEDNSYVSMGNINDFQYTVTVAPYTDGEEYKTNINLALVPGNINMPVIEESNINDSTDFQENAPQDIASPENKITESNISKGGYTLAEDIDFPDDYPEKIIPIYTERESVVMKVFKSEQVSVIGYATTGTVENVAEYYREKLKNTEGLVSTQDENGYSFTGNSEGVSFTVYILKNIPGTDVNDKYKSLLTIQYLNTP